MIPHLRTARLVGVFGDDAHTAVEWLRMNAKSGGIRAIRIIDAEPVEGRRFAKVQRQIAQDMDGLVLLDLSVAEPRHVKAVLSVADLGVAAVKGSDWVYLIPRDGNGLAIPFRREGAAA